MNQFRSALLFSSSSSRRSTFHGAYSDLPTIRGILFPRTNWSCWVLSFSASLVVFLNNAQKARPVSLSTTPKNMRLVVRAEQIKRFPSCAASPLFIVHPLFSYTWLCPNYWHRAKKAPQIHASYLRSSLFCPSGQVSRWLGAHVVLLTEWVCTKPVPSWAL